MKLSAQSRAHLEAAFHWSPDARVDSRRVGLALLTTGAPILAGLAAGKPGLGFLVGLGAMLLAGDGPAGKPAANGHGSPFVGLLSAVAATMLAAAIGGHRWSDVAVVVLAGAAATLTSYSRPVAVGAIRFVVFLTLGLSLSAAAGGHDGRAALMFGLGALWRAAVGLVTRRRGAATEAAAPEPERSPTPAQRSAHWWRTMKRLDGWQYPLRLAGGLALALLARDLWPDHHYGWMVLAVALLTPPRIEHLPVRITQRSIGTAIGVGIAGAILHFAPTPLEIGLAGTLIAALAPIARAGNYAAYSALSTPMILLAMDIGRPIASGMLADRLVATLGGAAIVIAGNVLTDRWPRRAAQ